MTLPPNLYTDANWAKVIAWMQGRRIRLELLVPWRGDAQLLTRFRRPQPPVPPETLKIIHDFCFGKAT